MTYQREFPTKEKLEKLGVHCFVPVRSVRRRGKLGQFEWTTEAAIHNYLFIHTTKLQLKKLKQENIPCLRYIMQSKIDGYSTPLVVPDKQMNNFIAVAGNINERVLFLDPNEVDLSKGDRVRIIGGPFEGVEGVFMRVQKKHEKRVVIKIDGVTAVATTSLPGILVEKIE